MLSGGTEKRVWKRIVRGVSRLFRGVRPWFYLAPALVILGMFSIYPTVKVFAMSFYTRYNYFKHQVFEYGVDNYMRLFADESFRLAVSNTVRFVLIVVPLSLALSTLISVVIMKQNRLNTWVRNAYFLPFVTSTVAVAVVFQWIFHSRFGLLNYVLSLFGVEPIAWLTDPNHAMTALVILCVWKTLGYNILILLTGLRNIPADYERAARIDGASRVSIFFRITLPLLAPTLFFVTTTSLIGSFKVFSEVFTLFHKSPGPVQSCLTIVYYIYDRLTNHHSYGLAATASVVLFVMILAVTLVGFLVSRGLERRGIRT